MSAFRGELERAERRARRGQAPYGRGPVGGGSFGGRPAVGASAPALFLSGQSNAGNQDSTPGTVDARVSLTWSSPNQLSGAITGPGPMALQVGGHSFEWQAGSNMAANFNSNILTAKYWVDGSLIEFWVPSGAVVWPGLASALENFALQCVAAGISQVEFGWCQGESNVVNSAVSTLPTFQSQTNDLFNSVQFLLEAYGLNVHFTIIKTNSGLTTGVNPGDVNAASLTAVRGYQSNLAVARTDTSTIDPFSNAAVHYINGQTNTIGAQWATAIAARYTAPQPAFKMPPTVEGIMGASVLFDYDARAITGLVAADPVSSWPDLGSGAHTITQAGTPRPTYRTNVLLGMPEVEFDGVDDFLAPPGVMVPSVSVGTPFFSIWVGRNKTWAYPKGVWNAAAGSYFGLFQADVPPKISPTGSAASGVANASFPLNTFGKVENLYSNSSTDYQQVIGARQVTGSLGPAGPGSLVMARRLGGDFGNVGYLRWIACNAEPTTIQRDKLRGYGSRNYRLAVWGAQ